MAEKNELLQLRIAPSVKKALEIAITKQAAKEGRLLTISEVVRELISDYIESQ